MKIYKFYLPILLITFLFLINKSTAGESTPKGKLFIIGGGSRPDAMVNRMIEEAKLRLKGYVFILPMASEDADSAIIWSGAQFIKNGISKVIGYNFKSGENAPENWLDSLRNASLIYISGGDQARFMKVVSETLVYDAIHAAYQKGAIVAGTSAGAAVMSKMMITGNELLHPKYNETFKCIETKNIEFAEGLGLISNAIIDQHFVIRSRHNRLITAVLENPKVPGIGIDESTAILVSGNRAEVVGTSQVLVFRNTGKGTKLKAGKIGGKIQLEVFLPGDSFQISNSK